MWAFCFQRNVEPCLLISISCRVENIAGRISETQSSKDIVHHLDRRMDSMEEKVQKAKDRRNDYQFDEWYQKNIQCTVAI